jgi:hypothetical protein
MTGDNGAVSSEESALAVNLVVFKLAHEILAVRQD